MSYWDDLMDETKRLIQERQTIATANGASNGLMAKEDYNKLQGIDGQANHIIVDAALDSFSSNPVENKRITSKLDGLELDLTSLNQDIEVAVEKYSLKNTQAKLNELNEAYDLLFSGIHRAADSDNWFSFWVVPSDHSQPEFTFSTGPNDSRINCWWSNRGGPLFWSKRDKSEYCRGCTLSWDDFTLSTTPGEIQYSYKELESIKSSITNLINNLNDSNITSTQTQLALQLPLFEKYYEMINDMFTKFLIGYCNSSSCDPTTASPFTEWLSNLAEIKRMIDDIKAWLSKVVDLDDINDVYNTIEDVKYALTTFANSYETLYNICVAKKTPFSPLMTSAQVCFPETGCKDFGEGGRGLWQGTWGGWRASFDGRWAWSGNSFAIHYNGDAPQTIQSIRERTVTVDNWEEQLEWVKSNVEGIFYMVDRMSWLVGAGGYGGPSGTQERDMLNAWTAMREQYQKWLGEDYWQICWDQKWVK